MVAPNPQDFIAKRFNILDWYWFVAGDTGLAYSSRRNVYVDAASDADYAAWKQTNGDAVPIDSEADLWASYMNQVYPLWMFDGAEFSQPAEGEYTATQLKNYSEKVRLDTVGAGMVADGIPIQTDLAHQQRVTNARIAAEADQQYSTTIIGTDGVLYPVNASKAIAVSDAFLAHATDIADCSSQLYADIDAGTVTTLQQIDDRYSLEVRGNIKDGRSNHYHRK